MSVIHHYYKVQFRIIGTEEGNFSISFNTVTHIEVFTGCKHKLVVITVWL